MSSKEIKDEFDDILQKSVKVEFLSLPKILTLCSSVVLFGLYIGSLLYGANSIEVLSELKSRELFLKRSIINLKQENANLQKKYFELKGLEAQ